MPQLIIDGIRKLEYNVALVTTNPQILMNTLNGIAHFGIGEGVANIVPGAHLTAGNITGHIVSTDNSPLRVGNIDNLLLQNNANANVNNELPLRSIKITGNSNLTLENNYIGENTTDICIKDGSKLQLSGVDLSAGDITLGTNSTLSFIHENKVYQVSTENKPETVQSFENLDKLIQTSDLLNAPAAGINFLDEIKPICHNTSEILSEAFMIPVELVNIIGKYAFPDTVEYSVTEL